MGRLDLAQGLGRGNPQQPQGFTTHIPSGRCRTLGAAVRTETGWRPSYRRATSTPPEAWAEGIKVDIGNCWPQNIYHHSRRIRIMFTKYIYMQNGSCIVQQQRKFKPLWNITSSQRRKCIPSKTPYAMKKKKKKKQKKARQGGKGEGGTTPLSSSHKEQPLAGQSRFPFPPRNQLFLPSSFASEQL